MTDRPQQERGRRRRADILAATERILLADGAREVTHRAVASAAQVPASAIRYYFSTREALLLACLDAIEERRSAEAALALAEALEERSWSAEEVGQRVMRIWYGADLDDRALRGAVGWLTDCSRESPALSERLIGSRAAIDAELRSLLDRCGYSRVPEALVAAVADGSVLSSAAEARGGIAARAVRDLMQLLQLGGAEDRAEQPGSCVAGVDSAPSP